MYHHERSGSILGIGLAKHALLAPDHIMPPVDLDRRAFDLSDQFASRRSPLRRRMPARIATMAIFTIYRGRQ
jgi:hypothetical protein